MKSEKETKKSKALLSKKAINKAYLNWMFLNLSIQNFERMQGPAIVSMLESVKEDLYPGNKQAQKELLERHTCFFNTEPYLGSLVPGIVLGMESEKANGGDVTGEFINAIKAALMGPFAGIGDSLLPGTLIPILLSIAIGLSTDGSVIGPVFYIVVFLAIMLPLTKFLFTKGCEMGESAATMILNSGIKDKITKAAETVGLVVVGAITAMYASVNTAIVFTSGEMTISLQNNLDSIFPKLLTFLFALLAYNLVVKKKWTINKLMLFFFIVAIVGYFTHILGV